MSQKRQLKHISKQMTKQCEYGIIVSSESGQINKREAVFRVRLL